MLALAFFSWWYGSGWKLLSQKTLKLLNTNLQTFSVGLLFRTLFQPWRRIVTHPGDGLSNHFKAALDNAVSRLIGTVVRLLVIIAGLVVTAVLAVLGLAQLIVWPLLPALTIALIVLGLVG